MEKNFKINIPRRNISKLRFFWKVFLVHFQTILWMINAVLQSKQRMLFFDLKKNIYIQSFKKLILFLQSV